MTNHQSNIIFYTVISVIITALAIQVIDPDFYENVGKNKEELLLKDAVKKGDHNLALTSYQRLVDESIDNGKEINAETAEMYEDMAKLHSLLGNAAKEKNHYLKSLTIREKLPKNDVLAFANTYYQLGILAEEQQQYEQALAHFQKALYKRLGDTLETAAEDDGFTNSMLKSRLKKLRLNNEDTIATFKKLAAMHIIKKEYSIAKTYYERALSASKLAFGESDNQTLEIENLLDQLQSEFKS